MKAKNNKIKYNQLGAYLAGLIKGDGNIITSRFNVKGYPQIEIAFDIKDIQLAKMLALLWCKKAKAREANKC